MVLGKVSIVTLAVALTVTPLTMGSQTAPPPPTAVFALAAGEAGTLVYWPPVPEVDVVYRVYGVLGDSLVYVEETSLTVALVPTEFPSYAVTTIIDGVESAPSYAIASICVGFIRDPPYVEVRSNCALGVYGTLVIPRPSGG